MHEFLALRYPRMIPGETAFSYISACHRLLRNSAPSHTLQEILGMGTANVCTEFPKHMDRLATATGESPRQVAEGMTIIRFYRPFICQEDYDAILDALADGGSSSIHSKLSCIANRIPPADHLRYCAQCCREDVEQFGRSFWHVTHQLPGVFVCIHHNIHLTTYRRSRKRLFLPSDLPEVPVTKALKSFIAIAKLCESAYASIDSTFERPQLRKTYLARLRELGSATPSGQVKQNQLSDALHYYWSGLFSHRPFDIIERSLKKGAYPSCLFYNQKSTHHPLKHLLLIGFLFQGWDEFQTFNLATLKGETPAEKIPDTQLIQKPPEYHEARKLLREGCSLRRVSSATGISIGTAKALAAQECVFVSSRPQKIFKHEERAIIRKLFIGVPTEQIATQFNISTGAVETILRGHPRIVELRKRIRFFKKLRQSRQLLSKYLEHYPKATRNQCRTKVGASYSWLFKHDKVWLYDHLPSEIPRTDRYRRG